MKYLFYREVNMKKLKWGWHWRYDKNAKAHKVGIGLYTEKIHGAYTNQNRVIEIKFPNILWI